MRAHLREHRLRQHERFAEEVVEGVATSRELDVLHLVVANGHAVRVVEQMSAAISTG